ncbi:tRNA(Ile)-lysidine synthase [Sinisalibacter aestuarii]|uniref:tRNA(Ile)-lysidine synthase n=1 Tax=Sinisalibacter aestuarii TaxID=2949426 RepID=A0ABQ5LUX4_9RHOB|nr:tRNA(Ile)-lysidine synthase [Sinisalibacter aestuarii]
MTGAEDRLGRTLSADPFWKDLTRLGVAVSGGGDSMALLHLLAACAPAHGVTLAAATVDHGLRPEAAAEAAFVAETCARLGIAHDTLRWQGWDGQGNLQAEARAARYRLLGGWAVAQRLDAVALAHTADDQAETFVMRLAREAGVDGLAAMDPLVERDGARFWRPVLAQGRDDLRSWLSAHGLGWCDDPSNEDERYDRVRARKALAVLAELGIDRGRLGGVSRNLAAASRALKRLAHDTARRIARVEAGDVLLSRAGLRDADAEIRRRLLAAALGWISRAPYPPRREALADLDRAIAAGQTHTLHGCLVACIDGDVRFLREFNAVKDVVATPGQLWDGRWRVAGPDGGRRVGALGEAVKDCPDWRETGLPRAALMASPAVWQGETLVAAPLAGFANGYSAVIDPEAGDFFTYVLSH